MDNIIGIDFSLNSAAFCVLNQENSFLGSLYRSKHSWEKLISLKNDTFITLSSLPNIQINLSPKIEIKGEYYQTEKLKLKKFVETSGDLFKMIKPFIGNGTKIFMEGISFNSNGSSIIDISMCTALLRNSLVNMVGEDNFFVFSPSSIKMFAYKGNAKKWQLYEAFLENKDSRMDEFRDLLRIHKDVWIRSNADKDIVEPCSDLIDAVWIALFGEHFLETFKRP